MYKIELVKTCGACPEQYDAYFNGDQVGYLRLRHGIFRVDYGFCGGDTILIERPEGDGCFEEDERGYYLDLACQAIMDEMFKRGRTDV